MKKFGLIFLSIIIIISACIVSLNNLPKSLQKNSFFYNLDAEESIGTIIEEQIDELEDTDIENVLDNLGEQEKQLFNNKSFIEKVKGLINGEYTANFNNIFSCIFSLLAENLTKILPIFAITISIAIISSLLSNFNPSGNKSIKELINFVCFSLIIVLVLGSIAELVKLTSGTLYSLKSQMEVCFPILLTLMTALGSTVSVSVYQPTLAILSGGLITIFSSIILPLFVFSLVFSIVGNLSSNVRLNKFSELFNSIFKWIIGFVFTIFSGILMVQGISAGSFDGLSIKTAKYTIKSYIPILGGYLSDGLSLVLTSSMLIKNAVGVAGLLLCVATVISPIIYILVFKLGLQLTSSIVEPLGNTKLTNLLSNISKSLIMLIVTIIAFAFAYIISIGLIMCSSNIIS